VFVARDRDAPPTTECPIFHKRKTMRADIVIFGSIIARRSHKAPNHMGNLLSHIYRGGILKVRPHNLDPNG
jgi:hypothetical protein